MIGFISPTLRHLEAGLLASKVIDFIGVRSAAELKEKVAGAEAALIGNSAYDSGAAQTLRSATSLRWIQTTSIGIDNLMSDPPRRDVVVTNAGGLNAPAVAEHAVTLLLALSRNLRRSLECQRVGWWARQELAPAVRSLAGRQIVCLGYGAVGREVARKLAAFDAEVTVLTRSGQGAPPARRILPYESLGAVLPTADAVILALPLAPWTRGIIGRHELALMKPTAVLVNVGRGPLVDEVALAEALTEGHLAGAGLDVFAAEPLSKDSPLWKCPGTILTPHLGGQGGDGERLLVQLIHENAARLKHGQPLANVMTIR